MPYSTEDIPTVATEPTESEMHGQCNARPMVISPTKKHCHSPSFISYPAVDKILNWPQRMVTYLQIVTHLSTN